MPRAIAARAKNQQRLLANIKIRSLEAMKRIANQRHCIATNSDEFTMPPTPEPRDCPNVACSLQLLVVPRTSAIAAACPGAATSTILKHASMVDCKVELLPNPCPQGSRTWRCMVLLSIACDVVCPPPPTSRQARQGSAPNACGYYYGADSCRVAHLHR